MTDINQLIADTMNELAPDDAAQHTELIRRLQDEQTVRVTREADSAQTVTPPRRRLRRPRIAAAAVLAGAAATLAAIALSPLGSDPGSERRLPTLDTARAALLAAGDAAGDVDWTPLGPGEYVHTVSASYEPELPEDAPGFERMGRGGIHVIESWRDGDRHSRTRTGSVESIADITADARPKELWEQARPRGGTSGYQRSWRRTADGYRLHGQSNGSGGREFVGFAGLDMDVIDAANANPDPVAGMQSLLDAQDDDPFIQPTELAITNEQLLREVRIEHAIDLLGSAPITPAIRRELYRWLAEQPHASVTHDVADEQGRVGSEVIIEHIDAEDVPAHTVSAADIINEHRRGPQTIDGLDELDATRTYEVPDNRRERRWRVGFIVDVERGELLQRYLRSTERTIGKRPFLVTYKDGPRIDFRDPGGGTMTFGAFIYLVRDRTTDVTPTFARCEPKPAASPKVCT